MAFLDGIQRVPDPAPVAGAQRPAPALVLTSGAVAACLALPWLLAWAPGPSPNVGPWLVTAALTVLAWGLVRPAAGRAFLPYGVGAGLLALAAFTGATSPLDPAALAAGLALVLLAASLAAGQLRADGGDPVRTIALAWLLAALLSAGIALLQFFGLAAAWEPWLFPSAPGQALGQLRQRNQLGSLMAIGFAAALWLAGRRTGQGALADGAGWRRLAAAVVLLAVASAATASRTGALAWLLVAGLVVGWPHVERRRRIALAGVGLVAYAVANALLPLALRAATGLEMSTLFNRVFASVGCGSRRVLWDNVLHLISLRPLLGWGWGELDYAHYATLYPGERFCDILDNAHNLPLHLAVELGVPLALYALAHVAWAVLRVRPWREPDPARQLAWAVLGVVALHSLLEYPLWYGPFQVAAGLALGLLLRRARPDGEPGRIVLWPWGLAPAVALLLAGLLAYVAWDYRRVARVYQPPQGPAAAWRAQVLQEAGRSRLFTSYVRFARVTLAPVSAETAGWLWPEAEAVLHYSPEPRVIERALESAVLLRRQEAELHKLRYQAAFPDAYESWRVRQAGETAGR